MPSEELLVFGFLGNRGLFRRLSSGGRTRLRRNRSRNRYRLRLGVGGRGLLVFVGRRGARGADAVWKKIACV